MPGLVFKTHMIRMFTFIGFMKLLAVAEIY